MNYLIEVLRLVHILGGMFWFGAVMMMYFFIVPSVTATGESGQQFMKYMGAKSGMSTSILVAAVSACIAGAWMYWLNSDGLQSAWMYSSSGIMFALGGIFGGIALVAGIVVNRALAGMGALGAQIQGKPTPEQMAKIQSLQKRNGLAMRITTYSMILTGLCMALARYLVL